MKGRLYLVVDTSTDRIKSRHESKESAARRIESAPRRLQQHLRVVPR